MYISMYVCIPIRCGCGLYSQFLRGCGLNSSLLVGVVYTVYEQVDMACRV